MAEIASTPSPAPLPLLIDGARRPAEVQETLPVVEPATGRTLALVPRGGEREVDLAVRAAARAFPAWRDVPVPERAQVLFRYKAVLEREWEALAISVARENGKLLDDARNEVRRGIEVVDFACGMPTLAQGRTALGIARGIDSHTWRGPIGPMGTRQVWLSMPRAIPRAVRPWASVGMPQAKSTTSIPRRTSFRASSRSFPFSRATEIASASHSRSRTAL